MSGAQAEIPLQHSTSWRSIDNDYATGGVLCDLDGDGYLDLVTGNGNDMAENPIRVYYSIDGTLEEVASWSSSDVGYHCHIDMGDYDGDGDFDLAVALLGDPGTPQRDKIYENQNGTLSSLPVWISGDLDNSFDLAWGDMDGDGDIDLAVACGETYTLVPQKSKIYRNDNGVITEHAVWRTGPVDYSLDVAWGDVDNDGDLDLAFANEFGPNRIYLNNGSGLDSIPAWESADSANSLQLDFGDVDGDGWLDLAVANNAQLGGNSDARIYRNLGGVLETNASWISTDAVTYRSAVTFGDVDSDGDLDLASGGWWEKVVVFENLGGTLETSPSYSWKFGNPGKQLVVESCVWGDLNSGSSVSSFGEAKDGDGVKKVFYFDHFPIRSIGEIRVGGSPVPYADFSYDPDKGWIALKTAPPAGSGNVEIDYVYSRDLDLVVTNWDRVDPSLALFNDVITGIAAGTPPERNLRLHPNRPNPFNPVTVLPFSLGRPGRVSVSVFDLRGRLVRNLFEGTLRAGSHEMVWDGTAGNGHTVSSGIYLYRVDTDTESRTRKMALLR